MLREQEFDIDIESSSLLGSFGVQTYENIVVGSKLNEKEKMVNIEAKEEFWNDTFEAHLYELYMRDDVVDMFWGQRAEECIVGSPIWRIYVVIRGLYHSHIEAEKITDNQVIHFIAEEEGFIDFSNSSLSNSVKISHDLKEKFDKALDNELGLSFRKKHYNLVGIDIGYKRTDGQLTNILAILLYVRQKGILRRGCDGIFSREICGLPVDVIEAGPAVSCAGLGTDTCRRYQKDVKLGSSIGIGFEETQSTVGTLSTVAYESLSKHIGIISCEHVLKFNMFDSGENVTVYQPSYEDLFEPKKKLDRLYKLLKEPGITEDDRESVEDDIEKEEKNLKKAKEKNPILATYIRGIRKNFLSKVDNKNYGVDAGFCVFNNENRTLSPTKFSVLSDDLMSAKLRTCLEGIYSRSELMNFNHDTRIFKVGRTTGLTFGQLLSGNSTVACELTNESIRNAGRLEMEKNIPPRSNAEQKIFIGYMKSETDSEIRQYREKCFPVVWFDRQLAFKFESGDFESGDSGASIVDEKGNALGILHAKLTTQYQTFGIASPYFAVLEALNVDICLSSNSISSAPPSLTSLLAYDDN